MSVSSLLSSTLALPACSALRTLPFSGRIAWMSRSRPCLADPPAESPSTRNSSVSSESVRVFAASSIMRKTMAGRGPRTPETHEGRMSKTYRDWAPHQVHLFPPSPQDWLPEGDLVSFLLDPAATLDPTPLFAHYERELRGQPPFHPRMMVALLLYCYATGTRSSRRIMRRCQVDVACRVIVGEDIPDFRTISDFRKIHLARLETLFVEVLKLCALAGLVKVGTIALDGTKVKANASRHKAMSYDRMQEEEKRLKEEVARLLAEAESTDVSEDAAHGPDRSGEELPEELARRRSRLAKIQQAKALLEERARAEAAVEAARRQAEGKAAPK